MIRHSFFLLLLVAAGSGCKAKVGGTCSADNQCLSGTCCNHVCVDVNADPSNCGACYATCGTQNAGAICQAGLCKLSCTAGFGDCNAMAGDGCETDLSASADHCGSCATACSYSNAAATCRSSSCALSTCKTNFDDCDKRATNGCEVDLTKTVDHCGTCGTKCVLPNARPGCAASACTVASCNVGFGNCDMMAANGCESEFAKDPAHCGNCATACTLGQECVEGMCLSRELLIFGGAIDTSGTLTNDVWKFNMGTQMFARVTVAGTAPPAMMDMAYAWDKTSHRLIVFGGSDENFVGLDQTWALDYSNAAAPQWVNVATTGTSPSARSAMAFAWDAAGRKLYVFGGFNEDTFDLFNDAFVFDAATNTWAELAPAGGAPVARQAASGAFDSVNGKLIVNSGTDEFFDFEAAETWSLDPVVIPPVWTEIAQGNRPDDSFGATFFPSVTPMMMFGGQNFDLGTTTNALRTFDATTGMFATVTVTGMAPLARFSSATAVQGTNRFIYGGRKSASPGFVRDMWQFNTETQQWSQLRADSAVNGPAAFLGMAFVALE